MLKIQSNGLSITIQMLGYKFMRKADSKKYRLTYKDFENVLEKPLSKLIKKKLIKLNSNTTS